MNMKEKLKFFLVLLWDQVMGMRKIFLVQRDHAQILYLEPLKSKKIIFRTVKIKENNG